MLVECLKGVGCYYLSRNFNIDNISLKSTIALPLCLNYLQ